MDTPRDPQERKKRMMQLLQNRGQESFRFEPESLPVVTVLLPHGGIWFESPNTSKKTRNPG